MTVQGTPLLDTVDIPADIRRLKQDQLRQLADELRQETISAVSVTGGHLGAGLGVIELTVALHYVFNTPKDRLIWDVGHQAYPHKILTGRRDRIRTLRMGNGLSGFTKRAESEYDPFGAAIFNGVFLRILRAHWRFGLFMIYPMMLMTIWLMLGAFVGTLCMKLVGALDAPALVANLVGVVTGLGTFASALWLTEPRTYLLYLCDDGISTHQFAHGERRDWEQRMEFFAGNVVDAVRDSNADEVIVVGHSSGSFLAVDVLDRALTRDPALGKHGPRVRLLTIGANLPIVGFHPEAQWFRDRLRRLGTAADIDWVDYQSRHDIMNFWPFDPVAGHGILLADGERRNPTVVSISFRDLWKLGNFGRRRWRFFQAHFQFLLANERLGAAYDYYLICCGPLDLVARATKPAEAIAAMVAKNGPVQDPATAR